jgi:5-methylcytosine-specific restriction enzyme A
MAEPFRPSRIVNSTRRWRALSFEARRRDGFHCQQCGARGRLEVHHLRPVRTHPELGFDLANLITLCASCHMAETRRELGLVPINQARQAWRGLIKQETPQC